MTGDDGLVLRNTTVQDMPQEQCRCRLITQDQLSHWGMVHLQAQKQRINVVDVATLSTESCTCALLTSCCGRTCSHLVVLKGAASTRFPAPAAKEGRRKNCVESQRSVWFHAVELD